MAHKKLANSTSARQQKSKFIVLEGNQQTSHCKNIMHRENMLSYLLGWLDLAVDLSDLAHLRLERRNCGFYNSIMILWGVTLFNVISSCSWQCLWGFAENECHVTVNTSIPKHTNKNSTLKKIPKHLPSGAETTKIWNKFCRMPSVKAAY